MRMHKAMIQREGGTRASLTEEEAHHLVRVRRLKAGDRFLGLDGRGAGFECRLERGKEGWLAEILGPAGCESESPLRLVLGQALLKKDNFEWVVQKAAELGVDSIVPIVSTRTEVRSRPESAERKRARWNKILAESIKQSGRLKVPCLEETAALADFCRNQDCQVSLVLDEQGTSSLQSFLSSSGAPDSCSVIVGPEGGWDDRDREVFQRCSVPRVRLGPRILRAETAPIAILAILQFVWGDMGGSGDAGRGAQAP